MVSVIIPAYNAERTIQETVDSVLNQSCSNFELIIVNDGSTDNTLEMVQKIKDPRIKILSFENSGPATSRNRGIDVARGEFISFLDADDLWTSDKLEEQVKSFDKHPEAGVVYSWAAFIDESGKFLHAMEPIYYEGNVYKELLVWCFIISGSNVLARSKCIRSVGKFDPNVNSAEDWDFCIRLASKWRFAVVPRYQILYRIWSGAASYNSQTSEGSTLKVIEKSFSEAPYELQSLRKKTLSIANQYFTSLYLTRNPVPNWKALAFKRLMASVRTYPRILLTRNTQIHLWILLPLFLLPSRISPTIIRKLLRLKGRLMLLMIPELSESELISLKKGAKPS